eukprot:6190613-Amphidinium_carterae.2
MSAGDPIKAEGLGAQFAGIVVAARKGGSGSLTPEWEARVAKVAEGLPPLVRAVVEAAETSGQTLSGAAHTGERVFHLLHSSNKQCDRLDELDHVTADLFYSHDAALSHASQAAHLAQEHQAVLKSHSDFMQEQAQINSSLTDTTRDLVAATRELQDWHNGTLPTGVEMEDYDVEPPDAIVDDYMVSDSVPTTQDYAANLCVRGRGGAGRSADLFLLHAADFLGKEEQRPAAANKCAA